MPFSQRLVDIDGCRINLRRGGSGEPLLYLHGANGAPVVMPFMEKLSGRFDVIVPEQLATLPADLTRKNMELFAREVMPNLKALG